MRKTFSTLFALAVVVNATSSSRAAFVIDGVGYSANGVSDALTASFTTPDAAVTANSYLGYVQITVSGVGNAFGPALNDAFYSYTDQSGNPVTPTNNADGFFQLGFDTKPLTGSALSRGAIRFIAYDVLAGKQVSPGYVPAYRSDHVYDFVLKVDSIGASRLHFGVVDSLFSDNGGSYALTVRQLSAGSVPEPASLAMFGFGLLAITPLAVRQAVRLRSRN